MKEKLKLKNIIKTLKDNKQYRALFILGLYFIFFLVVILMFAPKGTQERLPLPKQVKEPLEEFKLLSNYEFEGQIEYNEDEIIVDTFNGYVDNNLIKVFENEKEYVIENNVVYEIIDNLKEEVDYSIIKEIIAFSPSYIYDLITQAELKTKTENYKNETLEKLYYFKLAYLNDVKLEEEVNMLITTIEDEIIIKEVIISFEDLEGNEKTIKNLQKIKVKYSSLLK